MSLGTSVNYGHRKHAREHVTSCGRLTRYRREDLCSTTIGPPRQKCSPAAAAAVVYLGGNESLFSLAPFSRVALSLPAPLVLVRSVVYAYEIKAN